MNIFYTKKKLSFHPDDDLADYIDSKTGKSYFNLKEISCYNRLMDESFEVCNRVDIDIYSIGLASMRRLLKPNHGDPIFPGQIVRLENYDLLFRIISIRHNVYELKSIGEKEIKKTV